MQVKPKSQNRYCVYLMCIWFHQTTARLSGFFCRLTSWKGELVRLCLNGSRFSHYFIFIPLTTETVKYTNENSFIENLASSKWAQRETNYNVTINNKCRPTFSIFRRAALSCKNLNMFVLVNCSVQRKRSNGNLVFLCSFYMCLIDMNKFFEKNIYDLWNMSRPYALYWLWFQ